MWKGVKVAVVLLGVGICGVTAWAVTRPRPVEPHRAKELSPPPAAPVETVAARNLRIFHEEVLPRQLAALKPLALGDGEVVLRSVEAFDVRLTCTYELRHAGGRRSAFRLEHNTHDMVGALPHRHTGLLADLADDGHWKPIDPSRPVVLGRHPLTGKELVLRLAALEAAAGAFERLPADDRTADEFRAFAARMDAAAAPFLGTWYVRGDSGKRRLVRRDKGGLAFDDDRPGGWTPLYGTRLDPDGRLTRLSVRQSFVTLSADGRRLVFEESGEWWSRAPEPDSGR